MANTNRVNGFRPVKHLNGAPYNGMFNKYVVAAADATAIYVGDLVKTDGAGDLVTGLPTVTRAAATNVVRGVVVGFEPDPTALNVPLYRAASTRRIVYVADNPDLIFEAQEDGDTTPIAVASIGLNASMISTSGGDTITGSSGMQIDSTSASTTATLELKLLGTVPRADNEVITAGQAYTRWHVLLNAHELKPGTGSAGV
jgi:hypothetical protein